MVIVNNFLNEVAKAINNESYVKPSHAAFSSTVLTPAVTDTSLATEYDRSAASGTRNTNEVTFTALRSGAIASSTGDYINSLGLLSASTGGTLFAEALVPSVLHSTTFDLEVTWKVTVERK